MKNLPFVVKYPFSGVSTKMEVPILALLEGHIDLKLGKHVYFAIFRTHTDFGEVLKKSKFSTLAVF